MLKNEKIASFRMDVWQQVMAIPMDTCAHGCDAGGMNLNYAVTQLVNRLTERHMDAQDASITYNLYQASDIAKIVGQIKAFIDGPIDTASSYAELVDAYLLGL